MQGVAISSASDVWQIAVSAHRVLLVLSLRVIQIL